LGTLRVQEALSSGAEIIATACPFCMRMLAAAVENLGLGDRLRVMDVAELLFNAMDGINQMKPVSNSRLIKDREACHV
jgi:Fe-S oxidoreductase